MAHLSPSRPTACLALADGSLFYGHGFGAAGQVTAELCFNTAMTGYQEIMTDPVLCRAGGDLHLSACRQCRRDAGG